MKSLQWKSLWRDITCVGGERAKTTTTGPHPKAAAEGGDVEGGTGMGAVAARCGLSLDPERHSRITGLCSCPSLSCVCWAGVRPGAITKPFLKQGSESAEGIGSSH